MNPHSSLLRHASPVHTTVSVSAHRIGASQTPKTSHTGMSHAERRRASSDPISIRQKSQPLSQMNAARIAHTASRGVSIMNRPHGLSGPRAL